jgi:hypothetical protein
VISLTVASNFDFKSTEYCELFRASNATAFQHPDWLDPFYRILAPAHSAEPQIVIGRDEVSGELLLILPLVRAGTSVEYAFLDVTDYACPVMRLEATQTGGLLPTRLRAAIGGGSLRIAPVREEHAADWRLLLGFDAKQLPFRAHSMPVAMTDPGGKPLHFSARRRNDLTRKANRLGRLELEVVRGDAIAKTFAEARIFPGRPVRKRSPATRPRPRIL